MPEMIRVCSERELPAEGQVCEAADGALCIARVNGQIAVLTNICPHEEGPLGQGIVENGRVVCPFHGWAFDVKTGAAEHDPKEKARVFPYEIRDGALYVLPVPISS